MLLDIAGLLLLGAIAWLWLDSLKAREAGMRASRSACEREGFLFLDESVAIRSVWPARDDDGRLRLRRVYGFEYSDTGNNRRRGSVTLIGQDLISVYTGPRVVPKEQAWG